MGIKGMKWEDVKEKLDEEKDLVMTYGMLSVVTAEAILLTVATIKGAKKFHSKLLDIAAKNGTITIRPLITVIKSTKK